MRQKNQKGFPRCKNSCEMMSVSDDVNQPSSCRGVNTCLNRVRLERQDVGGGGSAGVEGVEVEIMGLGSTLNISARSNFRCGWEIWLCVVCVVEQCSAMWCCWAFVRLCLRGHLMWRDVSSAADYCRSPHSCPHPRTRLRRGVCLLITCGRAARSRKTPAQRLDRLINCCHADGINNWF